MMVSMNEKPSTITPKETRMPRKRGGGMARFLNIVLLIAIIAVVVMFVKAEKDRRTVQQQLEQTANELQAAKQNSEQAGSALAEEILAKVRRHLDIPTDPAPTVATITDVEKLKASNEFYKPAKNGDHLIITEKRAILYDSDRDMILDVVPVRITTSDAEVTPTPVVPQDMGGEEVPPMMLDETPVPGSEDTVPVAP